MQATKISVMKRVMEVEKIVLAPTSQILFKLDQKYMLISKAVTDPLMIPWLTL